MDYDDGGTSFFTEFGVVWVGEWLTCHFALEVYDVGVFLFAASNRQRLVQFRQMKINCCRWWLYSG